MHCIGRSAFFKTAGRRRQIGRIDEGDGESPQRCCRQQWNQQVFVDPAQPGYAQPLPKLMQHPRLWQFIPIGQVGKATPGPLFDQHLDQQVERMHGSQQRQQMHAPKLGRTEEPTPTATTQLRKFLVDPQVRNVGRERFEQRLRASGG